MSRLVVPSSTSSGNLASKGGSDGDGYKERLVKYVPAESVAFYALVDKLISSNFGLATGTPPTSTATMLSWGVFLLGLIGTPIYFWRQRTPGKPWQLHAVLATIAFVLWAYTLSGSFFLINGWYSVFAAALLAPIFTFVAGFFEQK